MRGKINKMENKRELTTIQKKVLGFLTNHAKEKGFPPTLREIGSNFGLKGPKAPQKTLAILERKGFIRRTPGISRGIEILDFPPMFFIKAGGILSVPIVGRVQAGEPILAVENIEGYLNLDRSLASSGDVFSFGSRGTA